MVKVIWAFRPQMLLQFQFWILIKSNAYGHVEVEAILYDGHIQDDRMRLEFTIQMNLVQN